MPSQYPDLDKDCSNQNNNHYKTYQSNTPGCIAGGATIRSGATESEITKTLNDRGGNYGSFEQQAAVSESIKSAIHNGPNWWRLAADQREALDIIAVKIGRLLSGNPDHMDSWHDIQGYAKLVEDRLIRDQKRAEAQKQAAMQAQETMAENISNQGSANKYPPTPYDTLKRY